MENIPSKDRCVSESPRIGAFMMRNFEENLKSHHEKGHKYFIQCTTHNIVNELGLDKQFVIYLLRGYSPFRPNWGELKEKYDVEPLKYSLRREVQEKATAILNDKDFRVYFGDPDSNGNFKMKVDIRDKATETSAGTKTESNWVRVVKKPFVPKPVDKTQLPKVKMDSSKPTKAFVGKDKRIEELNDKISALTEIIKNLAKKD